MSIIEVPIDKVVPGMYLVGIDVSWIGSSFVKHRFLINLQLDIDTLKNDGVNVVDVNTEKSTVPCDGLGFKVKKTNSKPVSSPSDKKNIEPVEFSKEIDNAKTLRKETVDNLKKIFLSSKEGKPVKQEDISSIVNESHDSILRNTHALLSLFHSEGQQSDLENHSFNVMSLAIMLGERVDLSDEEISHLGSAALLMDIGWSELPSDLFKNGSPYTDEEFEIVKTHVDIGVDILEDGNISPEVVGLVAKHHERTDGRGYFFYEENDVPLMCRILSMADHYNSRIRGYYDSPAMIPSTVLKDIYTKAKKGSHDVALTELLVQLVGIFPVSSAIQLSSGEKGLVTKVNWRDAMNPTVTLFYDKFGKKLARPLSIDLSRQDKSSLNVRKIKTLLNINDRGVDPANLLHFNV